MRKRFDIRIINRGYSNVSLNFAPSPDLDIELVHVSIQSGDTHSEMYSFTSFGLISLRDAFNRTLGFLPENYGLYISVRPLE